MLQIKLKIEYSCYFGIRDMFMQKVLCELWVSAQSYALYRKTVNVMLVPSNRLAYG